MTRLEYLRRCRHFTQTDTAKLVGASQTTISAIERGMRPSDPAVLPALARLFHYPEAEADSLRLELLPAEAEALGAAAAGTEPVRS
jgi:transcriptional regulator with XRE-family HTH domain